jgi:hypothetical protein
MPKKIDPKVKERCVRQVLEHLPEYPSLTAAAEAVGVSRLCSPGSAPASGSRCTQVDPWSAAARDGEDQVAGFGGDRLAVSEGPVEVGGPQCTSRDLGAEVLVHAAGRQAVENLVGRRVCPSSCEAES